MFVGTSYHKPNVWFQFAYTSVMMVQTQPIWLGRKLDHTATTEGGTVVGAPPHLAAGHDSVVKKCARPRERYVKTIHNAISTRT